MGNKEQKAAPFKLGKRKKTTFFLKITGVKFLVPTTEQKELPFCVSKCGQVAVLSSGRPPTVI